MLSRNTIATIERIILDLNDLKATDVMEPLVQDVGINSLINDFKQLNDIVNSIVVDKKDEARAFNNTADEIRRKTRIILENEEKAGLPPPRFSKRVCDKIFEIQIKVARIASVNNKADSGKYLDPISMMEIDDVSSANVVALSTGHLIDKDDLMNYFSRNNAFSIVGNSVQIHHPVSSQPLSERDIADLREKGVTIPEVPRGLLEVNRVLRLADGERIAGIADSGGNLLARIPFNVFAINGALIGYFIGALLGFAVVLALIDLCPFTLAIGYSLLGIGVLGGMIERMKPDGGAGFIEGFFWCVIPCTIVISLASLIAPPLIGFLAAHNIIGSINIATQMLPLIEACIPVALGAIGLVAEAIRRNSFEKLFKGIYQITISIFTNIFGIMGALGGIIVCNVLCWLCCRNPVDDARDRNPAQPQREEARRDARNSLDIHRSLLANSNGNDDELAQVLGAQQQGSLLDEVDHIHVNVDESDSAMQQAILESSSTSAVAEESPASSNTSITITSITPSDYEGSCYSGM